MSDSGLPSALLQRRPQTSPASSACCTTKRHGCEEGVTQLSVTRNGVDAVVVCGHGLQHAPCDGPSQQQLGPTSSPQQACADPPRAQTGPSLSARQLPRTHINELPSEVLASILRRSLGSEHPARLCSATYTRDLGKTTVLRNDAVYGQSEEGPPLGFVRKALVGSAPKAGPLPAVLVCKTWRRVILHNNVIGALATDYPFSALATDEPVPVPSKLQLLMLRLDVVIKESSDWFLMPRNPALQFFRDRREMALRCLRGVRELKELVCCCPIDDIDDVALAYGDPPQRYLSWKFRALSPILPSIPGLTRLDISHCKAGAEDLHNADFSLGNMLNLVSLSLRNLQLGADAFQTLGPCIARLTKLQHLDLYGNDLAGRGLRVVLHCVKQLDALQTLDLQKNVPLQYSKLAAEESQALADCVSGLAPRRTLCDLRVQLSPALLRETLRGLASLPLLHTLRLDLWRVEHRDVMTLFDSCLMASSTLQQLEVRGQRLHYMAEGGIDQSAQLVAPPPLTGLAPAPLKSLTIRGDAYHGFRDSLVPRLSLCTALTKVAVEQVQTDKTGFERLLSQLAALPNLQSLSLEGSRRVVCGDINHHFDAFIAHADRFTSLRALNLRRNCVLRKPTRAWAKLAHGLQRLTALTELDLSQNGLDAEGVQQLAPALGALHLLEVLVLEGNAINSVGALALAPYLKQWPRLRCLALDYGGLTGDSARVCGKGVMLLAAHIEDAECLDALGAGLDDETRALWERMHSARTQ